MTYDETKSLTDGHRAVPAYVAQVALGVSKQRVFTLIHEGKLESVPFFGARWVKRQSLLRRMRDRSAS